jgi:CRP/FNR family transcriptional regulator, cyclic AMP receptor protein
LQTRSSKKRFTLELVPPPHFPPSRRRPSAIDKVGTVLHLRADAVLYRQGDTAENLYYLNSGAIAFSVESADDKQIIVTVQGPGTFFGARSLGEEAHNSTATALVRSTVLRLAKPAVHSLLSTDPTFARDFAMHMMRRVTALEEDQIDRVVKSVEKRLARMLLMLASLDAENAGGRVLERITEGTLAKMLGADPACIRKLLQEFRRAGHLGTDESLAVHSSLVRVLLPAHAADALGSVDLFALLR